MPFSDFRRRSPGSRRLHRGCRCQRDQSSLVSSPLMQPRPDRILTRLLRPGNFPPGFNPVNFLERSGSTLPSSGHNFPFRVRRLRSRARHRRIPTNEIMQKLVNNKNQPFIINRILKKILRYFYCYISPYLKM